jgi:hypothetical protein
MLSIGKLSHLAQLHATEVSIDQDVLDGEYKPYLYELLIICCWFKRSTMALTLLASTKSL